MFLYMQGIGELALASHSKLLHFHKSELVPLDSDGFTGLRKCQPGLAKRSRLPFRRSHSIHHRV